MVKPNFFMIGAPKCGTTAMSEYLREHPNIFISDPKEPMYFNFDSSTNRIDEQAYLSLFAKANPMKHLAVGEASTAYLASRSAVADALKLNPAAKFIVMLRNPVECVQSFHSQLVFNGEEDITDFEQAWRAQEERKAGKRIPASILNPSGLIYSTKVLFGDQMERLFSIVDRKKVHVILFDDFVSDTGRTYEGVLSFLGVPSDGRTVFEKINENKEVRSPKLQRAMALVEKKIRGIRTKLGFAKGLGIHEKLSLLNSRPSRRERLSPDFRRELGRFYFEDITKLSRLLERDLSAWLENQ